MCLVALLVTRSHSYLLTLWNAHAKENSHPTEDSKAAPRCWPRVDHDINRTPRKAQSVTNNPGSLSSIALSLPQVLMSSRITPVRREDGTRAQHMRSCTYSFQTGICSARQYEKVPIHQSGASTASQQQAFLPLKSILSIATPRLCKGTSLPQDLTTVYR
jgi:hypothetical protein